MKEKQKSTRGITLIALVVTIIVLIILAAVSINLIFGQSGIITRANDAKDTTKVASVKEQIQLKLLDVKTEKILTNVSITQDELKTIIEDAGGEAVIGDDGKVTGVQVGDTIIPIEEMTEGIIEEEEKTLKTDANGVVEGQSGYLGSGYDDPYIPVGFNHTVGTWNSGYTIKDSSNNAFVWVPCVTDQSKVKTGDTVETFKKTLPATTDEDDPLYRYFSDTDLSKIVGDVSPADEIRTSVGTYGGFYIAAYEAGVPVNEDGTTEIAATSATTSQKARSVAGATVWTNITRPNAITAAENMVNTTDGVKSGLISGECWDTTLQWMVNSSENAANEPNAGYDIDSTGKGWYVHGKTTTGQYPINNIYDMAGNVYEWTTENASDYEGDTCFVQRGGMNGFSPTSAPAARRDGYWKNNASSSTSFRVVLYK